MCCNAKTLPIKAELHYTLDTLPGVPKVRQWVSLPASIEGNKIIANLPPENATIWFLSLVDERNMLVSSELQFSKVK